MEGTCEYCGNTLIQEYVKIEHAYEGVKVEEVYCTIPCLLKGRGLIFE